MNARGTRKHRYRVCTSSNGARERLVVKHTVTERSPSALGEHFTGGIRVIVFIFSQGKNYGIDNR
jgi:hypothetical protein